MSEFLNKKLEFSGIEKKLYSFSSIYFILLLFVEAGAAKFFVSIRREKKKKLKN